jgi:glycosyltransferase involved in cell wall biosynthesis
MMKRVGPTFNFFLVGTEFAGPGGIQQVNRLLLDVFLEFARGRQFRLHIFSFRDAPENFPVQCAGHPAVQWHAFACRRGAMAVAVANEARRLHPQGALVTHAGLLQLALLLKTFSPRVRVGLLGHGVEVWKRLPGAGPHLLPRLDSLVAPSRYTAQAMARVNGLPASRVSVIPHSLPRDWASLPAPTGQSETELRLLTVARLTPADVYKGIGVLISAMPSLCARHPGALLRIAGDGSDRPRLQALAASLGVHGCVQFLGEVSDARLRELYADSHLFVLPSKKEGFGLVFLEAMFHGLPVVAAAAGGATDIVEHGSTGLLVSGNDAQELAAAMGSLLAEPERRRQMGAAAQQRVMERYLFSTFSRAWRTWLAALCPESVYATAQSVFGAPAAAAAPAAGSSW